MGTMVLQVLLTVAYLAGVQSQVVIDQAIFDDGYCGTPAPTKPTAREMSTASMDCAKIMEFIYVTRQRIWEQLEQEKAKYSKKDSSLTWRGILRSISRASSLMSAHTHFAAAITSQRTECFSENVRLLLIVNLRKMKGLLNDQVKQLWMVAQDGTDITEELATLTEKWIGEAAETLDKDLKTLRSVLGAWNPPSLEDARFYSHEVDGRITTMEALRRDTFEEWQLDKGLLRGLIRHVFPVDAVVADLGAGSGHYASWLNDTGLVTAYAFDGSPDIELVTKQKVSLADLGKPLQLWRQFDWTLCLEVAEHIPAEYTAAFLQNLDAHTTEGLILSWARPGLQGLGNANPRSEQEVLQLIGEHTGLHLDPEWTATLRASASVASLAESLLVLVRNPRSLQGTCAPGDSTCSARAMHGGSAASSPCGTEEGWIFAGNDVQMFPNVPDSDTCCELCRSHDSCRFWTYSREESHKDLCWIKSTREYRINHDGFVSGVRPA